MNKTEKQRFYDATIPRILQLIEGETDLIAVMATVACELHHAFPYFDWTGFYRVVEPDLLKIGPYQGGHGCLQIPFDRGICGAAARTRQTQLIADVRLCTDHIACASSTLAEIVIPIEDTHGKLLAVLDVDSDQLNAFDQVDQTNLEQLCAHIGRVG